MFTFLLLLDRKKEENKHFQAGSPFDQFYSTYCVIGQSATSQNRMEQVHTALSLPLRGKLAEGGGLDYPSFLPESQQPIIPSKPRPRQALSVA